MATFDERDFIQLDPDVIRARIKLLDGFALDPDRSSLGVAITSKAGEHVGEFKLEKVTTSRTALSKGFFAGDAPGIEYTLKLASPSQEEFRKLQGFVGKGRPGEVVIAVVPILSSYPEDAATTNVWIDLLLSNDQGYFTLVEGAEIPMARIRAASAGR